MGFGLSFGIKGCGFVGGGFRALPFHHGAQEIRQKLCNYKIDWNHRIFSIEPQAQRGLYRTIGLSEVHLIPYLSAYIALFYYDILCFLMLCYVMLCFGPPGYKTS